MGRCPKNSLIMNRDSNSYTFIFATIMVLVVASTLAFTASSLKSLQADNVRKEKMQNILSTIGIKTDREKAEQLYKNYINATLSLDHMGNVDETVDAFQIKLNYEIKKPANEQRFPLYKAMVDNVNYYIIPLRGSGLWDAIWGYISLKSDVNTIQGAVFDHKAETAGLGAEITQQWFMDRFKEEKVFDTSGKLVGINVSKTNNDPKDIDKNDHEVDAISGATITSKGLESFLVDDLKKYEPFLKNVREG